MFESSVLSVHFDKTASLVASLLIFNLSGLQLRCHCLCFGLLKLIAAPLLDFNRQVCNSFQCLCCGLLKVMSADCINNAQ